MLSLGDRASINDDHHTTGSTLWQPVGCFMIPPSFSGAEEQENLHTMRFCSELGGLLMEKWGVEHRLLTHDFRGVGERRDVLLRQLPREYNWYPFFWEGCPQTPASLRWYGPLARRFDYNPPSRPRVQRLLNAAKRVKKLLFLGSR